MKAFKIKKNKIKRPVFIREIRGFLTRPKLPHVVIFKKDIRHGWVETTWEDGKPIVLYHQYENQDSSG